MVLTGTFAQAQPREQIEARRIAFITRALDLSPAEAQRFWPVYNAYKTELEEAQQEKNKIQRNSQRALQTKSDQELERLADAYIALASTQAEIQARYHTELKKVLPIRKVVVLYKTEQEFNRRILQEIKRRQAERKNKR